MEKNYKTTITTLDGEDKEITLHRLTMRHGMKIVGLNESNAIEALVDMIAPDVLDEISPASLNDLVDTIMEKEKGFFDQLAKSMKALKPSAKNRKKSK